MIDLLLNTRPRKTAMTEFARLAAKNVENEFNDRLIMTRHTEA